MAPAKSASMAEGPALKLVHCTFTCGPMAFSNHPFALPTMAWAWVMLGNAPTRTTLTDWLHEGTTRLSQKQIASAGRVSMSAAVCIVEFMYKASKQQCL